MIHEETQTKKLFGTDSSMSLFVSLYLILLAFFIVLNSMSNQTPSRAGAVMDSVSDTFRNPAIARAEYLDLAREEDLPGPTDTILTDIDGLFMTEFSIPGRYGTSGGDVLEFTFPEEFLFARGSLKVRPDRNQFLDNLADAVMRSDTGHRQEIVFLFASGEGPVSADIDPLQELSIRRAGALARLLREKGLEDGTYTTGFAPAELGNIVVLVRSAPIPGRGSR